MPHHTSVDVAVVGGGIAGLTAAAYAARAGRAVLLCEKAPAPGGRAATTRTESGFALNLGPHALYRGGPAEQVLAELGVAVSGRRPSPSGAFALARGAAHALPGGLVSLLATGLFGLAAKLETARLLSAFPRLDPTPLARRSVQEWLADAVRHPEVRALVGALVRVSSYAADHERMSAGAALAQMQAALGQGVRYLDGGWQTLVDGLRAAAERAGADLRTEARAVAVSPGGARWRVDLAHGVTIDAGAVVLAIPPAAAAALFDGAPGAVLRRWAETIVPVEAACLDVGLSRLPRPRATFALGIDRPLYFSVHSASARLAPDGAAMIHVLKYQPPGEHDAKADERELEGVLDRLQPGWRALCVERRFLPRMLAAAALPLAADGGLAGRPGPAVPGLDGVYVAGDWVGPEGLLADASLASARQAVRLIAHRAPQAAAA